MALTSIASRRSSQFLSKTVLPSMSVIEQRNFKVELLLKSILMTCDAGLGYTETAGEKSGLITYDGDTVKFTGVEVEWQPVAASVNSTE